MIDLLCQFVAAAILSVIGPMFASYLTEKGKNQAIKEDIQKITELVETVKQENAAHLEQLKGALLHRINRNKFRYEKEFELLATLLEKLYPFRALAFASLLPSGSQGSTYEDFANEFNKKREALVEFVETKRAFFPQEIYDIAIKLENKAIPQRVYLQQASQITTGDPTQLFVRIEEFSKQILAIHDEIIEKIRIRVKEWDA